MSKSRILFYNNLNGFFEKNYSMLYTALQLASVKKPFLSANCTSSSKRSHVKYNLKPSYTQALDLQSVPQNFETFGCFTKFSFHRK